MIDGQGHENVLCGLFMSLNTGYADEGIAINKAINIQHMHLHLLAA